MSIESTQNGFLDLHGQEVHAFSSDMANVGFQRMAELLVAMLKSEAWRSFKDGLGSYSFLAGEFDYFLTQRGIRRDDVIKLPDMSAKATVDAAMDERRTGEEGYRRPVLQARAENPHVPGRPIEPFGFSNTEAKSLANSVTDAVGLSTREALGARVRRFSDSGGRVSKAPNELLPPGERLRRSAVRLSDDDLADLVESLKDELRHRKRSG